MERKDKEFIKNLIDYKNYWVGLNLSKEETIDGFIHSLLVMIDGDAGMNDFKSLLIVENDTGEVINGDAPLHELYHSVKKELENS